MYRFSSVTYIHVVVRQIDQEPGKNLGWEGSGFCINNSRPRPTCKERGCQPGATAGLQAHGKAWAFLWKGVSSRAVKTQSPEVKRMGCHSLAVWPRHSHLHGGDGWGTSRIAARTEGGDALEVLSVTPGTG